MTNPAKILPEPPTERLARVGLAGLAGRYTGGGMSAYLAE